MHVIACGSPYGQGGVGQHFAQVVEDARAAGTLAYYLTPRPRAGDEPGRTVSLAPFVALRRFTPLRFHPSWTSWGKGEYFDRAVARCLKAEGHGPAESFVGFVGKTLYSFRQAAACGAERLELIAVNSHVDALWRQHRQAAQQTGIHDSWLNAAQRRKTLREIERADLVHVHSEYTRRSFLDAGVPERKLRRMTLRVDGRFVPPEERPEDGTFRVVYIGRLEATKGVTLLLDAFARLSVRRAELTLMGGWSSRAMRRAVSARLARDPRVSVAPGDPLPVLHRADVLVHPTFEDGFGYAPMEALACGVPVVVTEDTGMKEYVREGVNGYVVPTGDVDALIERMEHLARTPLRPFAAESAPSWSAPAPSRPYSTSLAAF
ncbi:MAG: glycosyltransferase family 4 protein [Rhodothermaceae bacterium]|nr:glycosyltransferase family 4 protein [Rhodothermaceae bacterium]